jgi:uncharacterized membrane protein
MRRWPVSVVSMVSDVRSRSARLGLVTSILGLAMLAGAPAASAAAAITLTTPFPAIAVAPGSSPSFDVSITTANAGRVALAVGAVPTGWTAVLRGGGFTIDGIESPGGTAVTKVTLNVTVPADATAVTQHITVKGTTSSGSSATLAVDVRVSPNAAGEVKLTTDTPQLKGASDASFSFTLTLANDTPQDLPFSATATGPDGWTITSEIGSQAQAASVVVTAGSTSTVTITAKAATGAAAGDYPIAVDVTSGSQKAHADLKVTITGSYKLTMSTPSAALSMNANAGSASDVTLTLTNGGTADIPGAALTASAPTGWVVKFDPATIDVPANQTVQVVAHVTPSADAITGDYVTTMTATAPLATATADIRVTVQTSTFWGVLGIGLIAIVLLGLWLVFRRFGRR